MTKSWFADGHIIYETEHAWETGQLPVCEVCCAESETVAERVALIAAAPELLAACQEVLRHLPDASLQGSWDYESAKILRDAIARATDAV